MFTNHQLLHPLQKFLLYIVTTIDSFSVCILLLYIYSFLSKAFNHVSAVTYETKYNDYCEKMSHRKKGMLIRLFLFIILYKEMKYHIKLFTYAFLCYILLFSWFSVACD